MSRYITVSAKVSTVLKEKVSRLNINVSQLIREALEEEVRRREEEALRKLAREASELLKKVPRDDIAKAIREVREER